MGATGTMSPNRGLALYVTSVLALGAALLAWLWIRTGDAAAFPVVPAAFWFFLTLASELFWLETPTRRGMISMSLTVNVATLFLLPPHLVLTVGAASVLVADLLLHRRGLLRASFNAGQTVLSLGGALAAIRWLAGPGLASGGEIALHAPLAAAAGPVVFFLLNTGLVAGVISLHQGAPVVRAWRDNYGFAYQYLSSATLSLLGLLLVVATEAVGYIAGLLFLLFFLFVRDAYQRYVQMRRAALRLE